MPSPLYSTAVKSPCVYNKPKDIITPLLLQVIIMEFHGSQLVIIYQHLL